MESLLLDLGYAIRTLLKKPAFTAVAVFTLALGIGANTAIFSVVNGVLLKPLPYPQSEKLMEVGRVVIGSNIVDALSVPKIIFLRDNSQSFEAVTATQGLGSNYYFLSDGNQIEYINGLIVTSDFFRVMGVRPAIGRGFTAEEDSPAGERVVILGDGLWRRRFGADAGMISKTISLNEVTHTVIGIMPPGFEYYGQQDVFVPSRLDPASQNEGHNWTIIGRLKQDVTPDQARAELKVLFDKFQAAHPRHVRDHETFGMMNWRESLTGNVRGLLWILLGVVGFILLIACANVANMQLARSASRQQEMATRMALGAGGGRLVRQLLTEGVALALVGGGVGLLLALWGMEAMLALLPADMLPRANEINLDVRVLAFALGVSLLTGIVFSLAPTLQTLRVDVNRALKQGGSKTGPARGRLRNTLVVVEIALALTLTVGAGLLLRTFANLRSVDPGFEARNVLTVEISPRGRNYDTIAKLSDFYQQALERFSDLPGVETAALSNKLPLDAQFNLPYKLEGQSEFAGAAQYRVISPEYFRVMKMSIQRGRPFDERDAVSAEPVVIVNEAFARRNFADVEPLDQRLCAGCEYGDQVMRRVVGVVNETKQRSLSEAAPAAVYIPLMQAAEGVKATLRQSSFVLRTQGDPPLLSEAIRREVRQLDPTMGIRNLHPMEHLVNRSIAPQRFNLTLLSLFAGLGLLLAAVGIYGVIAYGVAQRTQEFGIRLALGAQSRDVVKLVMGQGMALVLVGHAFGLLASLGLTRLLKSLLFGVSATDTLTFCVTTLLLTCVALAACYIPARRAMKVDPIVAIRYE